MSEYPEFTELLGLPEGEPVDNSESDVDPTEGEGPVGPGYHLYQEDEWQVEITIVAKARNEVTPFSGIVSENRVTVTNVVTDSQLLRILNFIEPKPSI